MSLPALLQWAIIAIVLIGGIGLERAVAGSDPLVQVPSVVQIVLGGFALGGPWLLVSWGMLENGLVDQTVVGLALSASLWLLATKTIGVGVGGTPTATC